MIANKTMRRYRSILAIFLALITTLLISCGGPAKTAQPTYTSEQIAIIQRDASDIATMRNRAKEVEAYIRQQQPQAVRTLIRGPLGELRTRVNTITNNLLPTERKEARQTAQDLFNHLVNLDQATQEGRYNQAYEEYQAVLNDFDAFLDLLPEEASS